MRCKIVEKEVEKAKKILIRIVMFVIILILVVLIFLFRETLFQNISWESIGVIIACFTLIFTIVSNQNEKKRTITTEKNIRDQEKFEQEVDKILEFYPRMLEDYIINTNLELDKRSNPEPMKFFFNVKSLDAMNGLNTRYVCEIIAINNKVDYLYKFHTDDHPEFDKFKMKVNDMNQILSNEINNFSILIGECMNGEVGFTVEEAKHKVEKRTIYVDNISNVYQKNISDLYVLANNCIEERNDLSVR